MTKSNIAIFSITSILLFATMMAQEVYGEEDIPMPAQWGGTGSTQAIPDWVKNQFSWYVDGAIDESTLLTSMNWMFDNNLMHLSEKAALEVHDMRNEIDDLKQELEVTKAAIAIPNLLDARKSGNESSDTSSGERIMQPEFGTGDPDRPVIIGRVYNEESTQGTQISPSQTKVLIVTSTSDFNFASNIVDDILTKGGTTSAWNDGIAAFSQHGMSESAIPELAGIVVLCNNAIDKKTQSIDAELKILEQWLEMISEERESSSYDASDRLTSGAPAASTAQYRESDLDFISRQLSSIDQQINSLDTGITVFEEKLQSVGDDAQLANIDLQNSLQKQQQTLQTMSNVSKMLHDTAKAIISNMRA
jgi:hypothetical protein